MALTLLSNTDRVMSLPEYLDHVAAEVDVLDQDAVIASADALKALANNQNFLVDTLNAELSDWRNFQPNNSYSSQTLALGSGTGFFVRANIWSPPSNGSTTEDWENRLFAYAQPHDHNFSFMTVGYVGSGYATSIYEYDPHGIAGIAGEQVRLTFLENTTLPRGKIMFYRASRDVHSQEHPQEFSVSLNLMIVSKEVGASSQYWFDLEKQQIKGHVQNAGVGRIALCRLARFIGDDRTIDALTSISSRSPQPRVRAAAYASLAEMLAPRGISIWESAAEDAHPYVAGTARKALRALESGR